MKHRGIKSYFFGLAPLFLAMFVCAAFIGALAYRQTQSPPQSELLRAPNVILHTFDGASIKFEELRGRPIILYFWAAWCPYCVREMPMLEKFRHEYSDLLILGVHRSETESREDALKLIEKTGVTFQLVEDPKNYLFRYFGRGSLVPLTVFINREGRVEETVIGPRSEGRYREFIEALY